MSPRRPPGLPVGALIRIAVLIVLLVGVAVMKGRCGAAFENMFRALDGPSHVDGGAPRDGGSS